MPLTLKNFYKQGWKPGANTLWYLNLDQSDAVFTDTQGHTVNNVGGITYNASGVSEGCGYNNASGHILFSDFDAGENFPSQFTIMCFMKPTGSHYTNDHPMGISLCNTTIKVARGIGFTQNNGQVQFNHLREGTAWDTSTTTISNVVNNWHHYALTYNGTTMKGYVDGVEKISTNISGSGGSINIPTGFTLFGRAINKSGTFSYENNIQGYVDEAIVEDKVWTQQEIQDYLSNFSY